MDREGLKKVVGYVLLLVVIGAALTLVYTWSKRVELEVIKAREGVLVVEQERDSVKRVLANVRFESDSTSRVMEQILREKARSDIRADVMADSIERLLEKDVVIGDSSTASDSSRYWHAMYDLRTEEVMSLRASQKSLEAYARLVERERDNWRSVAETTDSVYDRHVKALERSIRSQECHIIPGVKCPSRVVTAGLTAVALYLISN